jgi:hypothetical protein
VCVALYAHTRANCPFSLLSDCLPLRRLPLTLDANACEINRITSHRIAYRINQDKQHRNRNRNRAKSFRSITQFNNQPIESIIFINQHPPLFTKGRIGYPSVVPKASTQIPVARPEANTSYPGILGWSATSSRSPDARKVVRSPYKRQVDFEIIVLKSHTVAVPLRRIPWSATHRNGASSGLRGTPNELEGVAS